MKLTAVQRWESEHADNNIEAELAGRYRIRITETDHYQPQGLSLLTRDDRGQVNGRAE